MLHRLTHLFFLMVVLLSCESKEPVTFNRDVAPIIHQNCSPCHSPGQAGPFNLISYRDVGRKARLVAELVENKVMPPWPANPNYSRFLNELTLTDEEISTIINWYEQGAPEGEQALSSSFTPKADTYFEQKPDLVIRMKDSVRIPGDNSDLFTAIKLPYEIEQDTFVKWIEFVPGNRKLVHHMNGHLIQYQDELKENVYIGESHINPDLLNLPSREAADSVNRYLGLLHDDGSYPAMIPSVVNYLPGVLPQQYPDGIGGMRIKRKGAFYLRNMHYGPSPVEAFDQSQINVFFTDKAPKRPLQETQLGTLGVSPIEPDFVIPPETVKKFKTSLKCGIDISLVTVNPHMHLLGKSFKAYALLPSGDTLPLIHIPEWDFRWQFFYTFPEMVHIPKGSIIVAEGVFDNRSSNPNNPFNPPKEIRTPVATTNMKTTDEMFQFIFNYLPYQPGDENVSLKVSKD